MRMSLFSAIVNELSEEQIGQLLAVAGPSSTDDIIPHSLYRDLVNYAEEEGIDVPDSLYVDVSQKDVAKEYDGHEWVTVECGGIHFEL